MRRNRGPRGEGSITETSPGHWLIRIPLGTNAGTAKRRTKAETLRGTRSEALSRKRALLLERDQGIDLAPGQVATGDWLRRWLIDHASASDLAPRTQERLRIVVERHLIPEIGHIPLEKVRPAMLAALLGRQNDHLDKSTIAKHFSTLKRAFRAAFNAGLIAVDPMDRVERPRKRHAAPHAPRALTNSEIEALIQTATGTDLEMQIRFLLHTGARIGELHAARWDDIELDRGVWTVRTSVGYIPGQGMVCNAPKTQRSHREIQFSDVVLTRLRAHRVAQAERRLALGEAWTDNGLIFPTSVGTYVEPGNFRRSLRAAVRGAGIANPAEVTPHTMRDTAISAWVMAGDKPEIVGRRAGGADYNVTLRYYTQLRPQSQQQIAQALDHVVG